MKKSKNKNDFDPKLFIIKYFDYPNANLWFTTPYNKFRVDENSS